MKRWPSGCSTMTSSSGSRPCERPCARRLLHRLHRVPRQQQLLHLVEEARRRDVLDQRRELRDRRRGLRLDRDAELGGEAHRAQHPHRVLAVARHRRADQLQPPRADVGDAADVVPHLLGRRVEVERVDREVAARGVLGLRPVDVVGQQPAVLVGRRRRLCAARNVETSIVSAPDVDVHEPEAAADDERAAEQRLHLLGPRVGGDVEVLGLDAEQQVAHGAADDVRLEAGVLQPAGHVERAARELVAAERMVGRAVDARLARPCPSPGIRRASRRRIIARGCAPTAQGRRAEPRDAAGNGAGRDAAASALFGGGSSNGAR